MMYRAELKRQKAAEKRRKVQAWNTGLCVASLIAGWLNHEHVQYDDVFGFEADGPELSDEESAKLIIDMFKGLGAEIVYKSREEA